MKILFNIISILIVVAVGVLIFLNTKSALDVNLWTMGATKSLTYHVNLIYVILATFVLGVLAGAFWMAALYIQMQTRLKEYQRKLEKTSIQSSDDSSKVAVLESKIEVLEKALKSALEKNN